GMALLLGLSFLAAGQSPLGLTPAPVEEPLAVQLWVNRASYTEGEAASAVFTVNRSAYIYLFDVRTDGTVRLLFPNGYSTQNFVSAGTHSLPEGLYQFLVAGPSGTDTLQIVASLAPLVLPNPSASDPYPLVGSSAGEAVGLIQAQIDALPPSDACGLQWATAWCSFTVIAQPQPTSTCNCVAPAPVTTYCPPVSPTPPLPYPPTVSYYCPPASPTPPLPSPPMYTCPPTYNPCPPVYNPCPPTYYNPCWPVLRFFFGFQISVGTP
ncbi:MAG: DUF4384 domain-containing protein, partial [Candidatus Bipolaricaulis sp.]|nr:DUF4384 domain-containing protein [Candidatus Bipolaricaulis sp.]